MARVKNAVNAAKKRRTVLERAHGYRGQRSRLYRMAKQQINMRHNLEHKSSRRTRRLNQDQVVSAADFKTIKKQLGH